MAALAAALACGTAHAQQINVKIGVLSDMSSLYADIGGPGSVAAAKLAVADFTKDHPNVKVEIVSGDHQNKPDIGTNIANQWFDVDKVDVIVDVPNSGVALAVSQVAANKNKLFLVNGAAASDLTGAKCNANTIHWAYDTWMLANGTGNAMVKTGGDTWFFLTADYAFGHALERDTTSAVQKAGGKVLGAVRHPLNTNDFSSFLLQAQSSKAKVVGLANAGGDTINSIKQAAEFGIVRGGQKLAGLLVFASDVNALGLQTAQGLTLTETWYWDMNDANRQWTKRWHEAGAAAGKFPTMIHAGVYSSILHYLKAVVALNGKIDDGKAVYAKMLSMPTDDILFGKGTIDAAGRKRHPAYLLEVKKPEESKHPGDFYNVKATIPANEAFRDAKDSGCPLVKS
ncbi:MAG TPA: ABC transporter substrate-binding protein [Pseudorhodoplanes sp.]|jgi:branched-chain amino acid transport system substrate-binding protein|nr:ABC transporter substrate-binding protein [Pseudorhodoplanes sp.]